MPTKANPVLPVAKLKTAESYFIAEANSLRAMKGTPWIFIGIASMIDALASLELGSKADRADYISLIRRRFPTRYKTFKFAQTHRKAGTGKAIVKNGKVIGHQAKVMTKMDLPEQMYFVFRCGLVHAFSLVPSATERSNGGRIRSITINSRLDAQRDCISHLDHFQKLPHIVDSVYFVDEDLLDDLIAAIKLVFGDKTKRKNLSKRLRNQPPIWPL